MISPFPKSSSKPGEGHIVVNLAPNKVSTLESITYQYPLKLISPSSSSANKGSVLVFLLSYGGGLVGGDRVNLSVDVQSDAKLSIVTQGYTKVFPSITPDIVTRQKLNVNIRRGAALCLLPDPVQPFERSVYEQIQIFKLDSGASLYLLDWVTQGRTARGENWSLTHWVGRNEVWASTEGGDAKSQLLVRDAIILDGAAGPTRSQTLRESMHGQAIIGTLVLRGPMTKRLGQFFLTEFAALPRLGARDFRSNEAREKEDAVPRSLFDDWRATRLSQEKDLGILWSAADVRGCIVVKFGAPTVEAGRSWIGSMLVQEGSIERDFGEQALICVR
ncbi:UreD urease accessory protein-domain-containing protein [Camillea tinctor]|nr:UreD urease accessory protein-domain-containing protein [Camillea tinctor]